MTLSKMKTSPPPEILTLRSGSTPMSLRPSVVEGLLKTELVTVDAGEKEGSITYSKTVPTISLYSDEGLRLYDLITKLKEYYPFEAEREILDKFGDEIACALFGLPLSTVDEEPSQVSSDYPPEPAQVDQKWGHPDVGTHNYGVNGGLNSSLPAGLVVELGAGSLTKTRHLLASLSKLLQPNKGLSEVTYLALDLERAALDETLSALAEQNAEFVSTRKEAGKVYVAGLNATYDEGLEYLQGQQALHEERQGRSPPLNAQQEGGAVKEKEPKPREESQTGSVMSQESSEASAFSNMSDDASSQHSGSSETHASSSPPKKSLLWLGSSVGNLTREEAKEFLANIGENVLNPGDTMLIGIDGCDDGAKVRLGYDDPSGVTRDFIMTGVDGSGEALMEGLSQTSELRRDNFDYISRWNGLVGRHEAYIRSKEDIVVEIPRLSEDGNVEGEATKVPIKKGEHLAIEVSYKYTPFEARKLFDGAGLRVVQSWTDSSRVHTVYLLEKAPFHFPSVSSALSSSTFVDEHSSKSSPFAAPTVKDWESLWKAWDTLTLEMIPREALMTKPIDLRHIFLFYLGHIPAFLDIHLSRHFGEPHTEPEEYKDIFERGIDPDMETGVTTHTHSAVPENPEDWPSLQEILAFEMRVRSRLRAVYSEKEITPRLGRVLAMTFEHEALHLETLAYIALQTCTTLQRPMGWTAPDFASLSKGWERDAAQRVNEIVDFGARRITIGHDDRDADEGKYDDAHHYGWDIENPAREVEVNAFRASTLPITNAGYLAFLLADKQSQKDGIPASWSVAGGELVEASVKVKTLYGEIPFAFARHWPCQGSATQLGSFAKSKGGRLPTQAELVVIHEAFPPEHPSANVGFRNWHPVPPSPPESIRGSDTRAASNGGVWEWTSTKLASHTGFEPSVLYPNYSADFFDEAHQIMLGGSYLTIPRIAGRASHVNWYQSGYPYVVAGARVVYD